jgi:hypothetical protein
MITATVRDTGKAYVYEVFEDGERVKTRRSQTRYTRVFYFGNGEATFSRASNPQWDPDRSATIEAVAGSHQHGGYNPVACGRCGHIHTTLKCDRCGF